MSSARSYAVAGGVAAGISVMVGGLNAYYTKHSVSQTNLELASLKVVQKETNQLCVDLSTQMTVLKNIYENSKLHDQIGRHNAKISSLEDRIYELEKIVETLEDLIGSVIPRENLDKKSINILKSRPHGGHSDEDDSPRRKDNRRGSDKRIARRDDYDDDDRHTYRRKDNDSSRRDNYDSRRDNDDRHTYRGRDYEDSRRGNREDDRRTMSVDKHTRNDDTAEMDVSTIKLEALKAKLGKM